MRLHTLRSANLLAAASTLLWGSPLMAASLLRGDRLVRPSAAQPAEFLNRAVMVAGAYGVVTSQFRTAEHNRLVGGVPNSLHLQGRAIDVQRRPGVTHQMLDAAMRRAGLVLVESLDEVDHSHFAFAGSAPGAVPALRPAPLTLASAPQAPAKPTAPRVLADDHGLLLMDLPRSPNVSGVGGN